MQTWEEWVAFNQDKMKHPVDFEEKFVLNILTKIELISPADVTPQYHFLDLSGGNRYIDFLIKNEEKGYFLSIEIDGRGKFTHDYLESTLERQNSLVAQVGTLVRYANKTWLENPEKVIKEISLVLSNQNTKYLNEKQHTDKLQDTLLSYQEQLRKIEKIRDKSPIVEDEITQLKSTVSDLKIKLNETSNNNDQIETINEVRNIGNIVLGLKQQFDDLKTTLDTEPKKEEFKSINSSALSLSDTESMGKPKSEKFLLTHYHMAILCVVTIALVAIIAYLIKVQNTSSLQSKDSLVSDVATELPKVMVEKDEITAIGSELTPNDSMSDVHEIGQFQNEDNNLVTEVASDSAENVTNATEQYSEVHNTSESFQIASDNARSYIGEYKKVCGEIVEKKEFSKGVYLNFDHMYPNQSVTAVIWANKISEFGDIDHYIGTTACITGEINSYRGVPQVVLNGAAQLE